MYLLSSILCISFISFINAQLVLPASWIASEQAGQMIYAMRQDIKSSSRPHLGLRHIFRRSKHANVFEQANFTPEEAMLASLNVPEHALMHPVKAVKKNVKQWSDSDKELWSMGLPSKNPPEIVEMQVPDDRDTPTMISLGYMAWNSYFDPESPNWGIIPGWNTSAHFGWVEDGIRGYVFSSYDPDGNNWKDGHDKDEIIAISIKGTSPGAFGVGGPTSSRDKFNDNMMFSCCCGRVDRTWFPICDCYRGSRAYPNVKSCSSSCLQETCRDWDDSYYRMAEEIYLHVKKLYPKASIWLVGHSLGGALASVTAQRFHIPAVAFEAPGDALFAGRISIVPDSKSLDPNVVKEWEHVMHESLVLHVGNSGDPIYLGVCNGPYSTCYFSGYALESKCHLGRTCLYDLDHIGDPSPPDDGDDNSRPKNPPSHEPGTGDGDDDCDRKWWWPFPKPGCDSKKFTPSRVVKMNHDIKIEAALSLNKHRMKYMLFDVMMAWKGSPPKCELDHSCRDCEDWEFVKD